MTAVAFHFGAPDKLDYTCRLLRKAVASGATVMVIADPAALQQLDLQLWATSPTDFVAHCLGTADTFMQEQSAVLLVPQVDRVAIRKKVLVNLADQVPVGFDRFERVIEVVSMEESDRNMARMRWRQYTAQGFSIIRHDLALKGAH